MIANVIEIFQKMIEKSIEKIIIEREKVLYYNYKKVYYCRKFFFFIKIFLILEHRKLLPKI